VVGALEYFFKCLVVVLVNNTLKKIVQGNARSVHGRRIKILSLFCV